VIQSNTQAHVDENLSIATGNFWEEEYVDSSGATQHGLTAGLWLNLRDPSTGARQNPHQRVHAGQEIAIGGYRIRVLEVTGGSEETVTVAVAR
jgi:hypothetical protein